jgi:hypothetical protein
MGLGTNPMYKKLMPGSTNALNVSRQRQAICFIGLTAAHSWNRINNRYNMIGMTLKGFPAGQLHFFREIKRKAVASQTNAHRFQRDYFG